jgi:hypothetical protein
MCRKMDFKISTDFTTRLELLLAAHDIDAPPAEDIADSNSDQVTSPSALTQPVPTPSEKPRLGGSPVSGSKRQRAPEDEEEESEAEAASEETEQEKAKREKKERKRARKEARRLSEGKTEKKKDKKKKKKKHRSVAGEA